MCVHAQNKKGEFEWRDLISIKQSAEHKRRNQYPVLYKRKRKRKGKAAAWPENNPSKFLLPSSLFQMSRGNVWGTSAYTVNKKIS